MHRHAMEAMFYKAVKNRFLWHQVAGHGLMKNELLNVYKIIFFDTL